MVACICCRLFCLPRVVAFNPCTSSSVQADPQMAAYIRQQQQRGRLPGLWAKAEVSEQQKGSRSLQGRSWGWGTEDSELMQPDDMEDDQVWGMCGNVWGMHVRTGCFGGCSLWMTMECAHTHDLLNMLRASTPNTISRPSSSPSPAAMSDVWAGV